jgi:molybdenum cofactor cytidylyltransferase
VSIAIIVLAAGGSTRMGRPKLLLEYRGVPLVKRAAQAALGARLGPVAVVVGSGADEVQAALRGTGAVAIRNDRWAEGMGTSIAAGVSHFEGDPAVEALIIMLADQPMVDPGILKRLAQEQQREGSQTAACRYAGAAGVPALFARSLFARLMALPASSGAKQLLADPALRPTMIDFAGGAADIDTPEDYRRLTGSP